MISKSEQEAVLNRCVNNIKHQSKLMRTNLDEYKLLPALKNCSNFLNELRVSQLSPKQYYEIYIMVFDSLEVLSGYLVSSDPQRKKKTREENGDHKDSNCSDEDNDETVSSAKTNAFLADLYEIVQYSGNIVPRLYMMIVVGTTYMALKGAPTKDLMKDMIEMCHGVQHPIRGLFLRYYLSQRTKNSLPFSTKLDFNETVDFLIGNFIEMNKLWVRLQHQGHSSERELRYNERKELKILVGSNLVRLSQIIDDYDAEAAGDAEFSAVSFYEDKVFPTITEQIIQCRDHLAQTYLVDVLIQIFPDEFHFATLEKLLNQVFVNLHPLLNKSELVNTLIEKFITYYKFTDDSSSAPNGDGSTDKSAIDVTSLFNTFWQFYLNLNESESDLSLQEHAKLLESFIKLSLTFDPSSFENLDVVYKYAAEHLINDEDEQEQQLLVQLLGESIKHFTSIKTILTLKNYFTFFNKLNPNLQKQVAMAIIDQILATSEELQGADEEGEEEEKEYYTTVNEIDGVFKYMSILIKQTPTNLDTAQDLGITKSVSINNGEKLATLEFLETQEKLNKLIQLIDNPRDPKSVISNLFYLRKKYLNKNFQSFIFTYPTLIDRILFKLKLVGYVNLQKQRQLKDQKQELTDGDDSHDEVNRFLVSNFKNLSVIIEEMYQIHAEYSSELILRKYLDVAMVSDQLKLNSITVEVFNQCYIIYEERLIILSHQNKYSQGKTFDGLSGGSIALQSILSIANILIRTRHLVRNDYEELIVKLTLYGSKLLKKQDGCRAISACAHLFWWNENLLPLNEESPTVKEEDGEEGTDEKEEDKEKTKNEKQKEGKTQEESEDENEDEASPPKPMLYREPKRVLECIQKSLRLADSIIDPYISLQLFIEILNQALIFHTYGNDLIDTKFISGLINLVRTNMDNLRDQNGDDAGVDEGEEDVETKLFKQSQLFFNQTLQQINLYG
ncbi:vps35 [Candida margitis]|uniref:vps35 n=1 Tax=Candida margitis TaxID=1775924 RepID=UPI0022270177|nr:vps35 [Candida margitis]KAI5968851.1 vps35 [Candida margitis]